MFVYLVPIFFAVLLATLWEFAHLQKGYYISTKYLYGFLFLSLGVFGGIRFQTGMDWPAYKEYFEQIDLSSGPFDSYFSNLVNLKFEIGYFYLNYYLKLLGFTYSAVFFVSSLFCVYCVYKFTSQYLLNKFYILTIYISYSFLILHFAQVRQSLAIGVFLLACTHYVKHQNKLKAILISLLAILFQFSAAIYIIILLLVLYFPKNVRYRIIIFILIPVIFILSQSIGFFFLLKLFVPLALEAKINIYEEEQTAQGQGQLIYGIYLLFCISYVYFNIKHLINEQQAFICNYAIFSLLLTVLASFIFPGNYVMYSRLYVLASIFQGYAITIILNAKKTYFSKAFFIISILIATLSYIRIINFYSSEYLPYRTTLKGIFSNFNL
jgi:hypothetical protein